MGNVIFYDMMKGEFGGRNPFLNYHNEFWFSINDYTRIQFLHIGYGEISKKYLQKEQLRDARHWMEEHCEGEIIIKYDVRQGGAFTDGIAYFQYESDAIAFKFLWLDQTDK